jgi:hypothetical protein
MAIECMHPAYYAHTGFIGKTRGPLGVTPDTLSFKRHSTKRAISEPVIPKKHRAVRRPHFEKALDYVLRLGMIVVVFSQSKLSVGGKEEQALYRFNFLNSEVIELASQLPKQKSACACPGKDQQRGEHRNVPECQTSAQMSRA